MLETIQIISSSYFEIHNKLLQTIFILLYYGTKNLKKKRESYEEATQQQLLAVTGLCTHLHAHITPYIHTGKKLIFKMCKQCNSGKAIQF